MEVTYNLNENQSDDLVFCDQCGTFFDDQVTVDFDKRTVRVEAQGCFSSTSDEYSFEGALDWIELDRDMYPAEPMDTLEKDIKEKL